MLIVGPFSRSVVFVCFFFFKNRYIKYKPCHGYFRHLTCRELRGRSWTSGKGVHIV